MLKICLKKIGIEESVLLFWDSVLGYLRDSFILTRIVLNRPCLISISLTETLSLVKLLLFMYKKEHYAHINRTIRDIPKINIRDVC